MQPGGFPQPDDSRKPAMHQPPNPESLRRTPPADGNCARILGLLRDFVDEDLSAALVASVDEHVHTCRTCAVELARSEHEVLRLRRAFDEVRAEQESQPGLALRSDFAARVVEQLVLTEQSESGHSDSGHSDSGHSDSGHSNAGAADSGMRSSSFTSPAGMLVAGLFALFVMTIVMRLSVDEAAKPEQVARLEITYAEAAFDGGRRRLVGGDVLGETQGLWLGRGGAAFMDWHDLSERLQPAARLEILAGELQFKDGAPLLMGGKVLVATNRDVEIPMADGSRVALGMGEYVIAAIPADMHEDPNHEPNANGMFPGDMRLEIEVRSGQPAVVLRGGSPTQTIIAGNTGSYQGGGLVDIYASGPVASGPDRDRVTPPPPAGGLPMAAISGHVTGPNGQPSVGANVLLQYAAGSAVQTRSKVTGANGGFVLTTEVPCESSFAVVFSLPSELRPELGITVADAVPVLIHNGLAQLQESIQIGYSAAVAGLVVDQFHVPLVGASVIPCIVDELFGSVYALTAKQTWSAANGRFKIEQLPADLPHHQRLILAVSHPSRETLIVSVPERGSPVADPGQMVCVVPSLRMVSFHGLTPHSTVTFLEEVRSLPAGAAATRRTFTANALGAIPFVGVGNGRMWLLSGSAANAVVTKMVFSALSVFTVATPALASTPYDRRFRPLQPLLGTNLKVVNSYRHQQFQVTPVPNIVASQLLHVVDSFGQDVMHAQVFAIRQSACFDQPDPRFLGFTAQNGNLSMGAVTANEDVFVIGPSGGLTWVPRPTAGAGGPILTVTLQAAGRVLLDPSLRPAPSSPNRIVEIILRRSQEMLPGMKPEVVRFATDGYWEVRDVPAGSYLAEVDGVTYPVVVPSTGFAVLGAQ